MSATGHNEEEMEVLEEEYCYNTDADTTCTLCQAEFLDPDDLMIHLDQIHKISDSNLKLCQFCSTTYTDLIKYAEHLRDKHILSLSYCGHCLRAFVDPNEAKAHQRSHKTFKKSEYNCTQCKMTFTHVTDLRRHDYKEHNNNDDGIMMQGYFPYLSAVMRIKAETVLQSVDIETIYICIGCEYAASTISAFLDHAKLEKCQAYVCNHCSNVYKKKRYLQRHLKICNKSFTTSKNVECPECHLVFNRYSYMQHKKKCRVIKCYTCDINFSSMYELSEHQSKDHPLSVELKQCKFCWRQCVGSVSLQKHIDRSHKPELHLYKYLCVYCKSPFKHPQRLFGHFFSSHKDLEPYTCKICDMKFRVRKKFTLHIKLTHKSIGYVEFDENYHAFFSDKKSEKPFIPKCIYQDEIQKEKKVTPVEKAEDSSNIALLNMNSEISVTETEGNQTEVETVPKPILKRKRAQKAVKAEVQETISLYSSDDDEPLLVVRKRVQKSVPKIFRNRCSKKLLTSINKKRFTCDICHKYCYTYQNYNHHISLHSKKDYKKCIKCSKVFRSKEKLNKHIANDHSTSKLTETLKHLIEKRKTGGSLADDLPMSERFRRTIKKVECEETMSMATITAVENGLSVQKFIENFMPEVDTKSEMQIDHAVTCSIVKGHFREPKIKMTKFETKPAPSVVKLAMPVKFKRSSYFEKTIASIRVVQQVTMFNEDSPKHDYSNYDDDMDHNDSIPEVAEEVMLEGTEETPKPTVIPHKIVIPKLPAEYKDIRIAHLLPEAPFYKIVKVNEVLKMTNEQNDSKQAQASGNTIKLADGTRLVTANPLAHLLGKTPIEKVLGPIKNKYYKPKAKNFQGMLVEALSKLDKPMPKRVRKKNSGVDESMTSDKVNVSSEKYSASIASDGDSVLGI